MSTATLEMKTGQKWTTEAGPRQTKQVERALQDLRAEGQTHTELSGVKGKDEHESNMMSLFGPVRQEVAVFQEELKAKYDYTITRENYKNIIQDIQEALPELKTSRVIEDKRRSPEEEKELREERAQREAERKAKAEKKAAENAENEKEWAAKYPYLEKGGKKSSWALGAANIRTELRRAFPGHKFSVTSDSFSMGCSIDIKWEDGPTTKEINDIVKKYETSRFDGMTDCSHSTRTHWNTCYGGAKYVQVHRTMSDATKQAIRELTPENDSPEDRNEWRIFADQSYYVKPEMPEGGNTESASGHIETHYHTKRGYDVYIVVLSGRVDRPVFYTLRSRAKSMNGWYSRKWGTTPGGFAFAEPETAQEFLETIESA